MSGQKDGGAWHEGHVLGGYQNPACASCRGEERRAVKAIARRGVKLDRRVLALAVEDAYEAHRKELGWFRWAGEADAIADAYEALSGKETSDR